VKTSQKIDTEKVTNQPLNWMHIKVIFFQLTYFCCHFCQLS